MSALSGSLVPGQWKMKSLPQGSLALPLSRYFCATRSSMLCGQLLVLSIMYCAVASRAALTRSRAVETCAFLNCLKTAAPTPPAEQRDDRQHDHDLEQRETGLDGPRALLERFLCSSLRLRSFGFSSLHEIRMSMMG